MIIEVKVPAVGESITEAIIGSWSKKSGDYVKRNDVILLLETDKASVEVVAENDGVLKTLAEAGSTVPIGAVIAHIDTSEKPSPLGVSSPLTATVTPATPSMTNKSSSLETGALSMNAGKTSSAHLSPAVQKLVTENQIQPSQLVGTGKDGRLTKGDVLLHLESQIGKTPTVSGGSSSQTGVLAPSASVGSPSVAGKKLVPMTSIRKKIAERLVQAQHQAALLTTFNEVDMSKLFELRAKYKDRFKEKYGVSLGFMGLFTKAAVEALKAFPAVNAYIVGDNIEYHDYFNVGIAVSTDKGLMVPVIKEADRLSVPQVELAIRNFALKARDGKISVDDLSGGTFSITNGGVFGSLLSTPILNTPQSAILGMHKVEDRPVAVQGKVEIRPMMYLALTYDHRMIDGKEAVSFLVKIKEGVEDPERLLLEI